MTVTLTISKTINGANVNDTLGGGGTGVDLGSVESGAYGPITLQSANTGWQDLYVWHNGTNAITECVTFINQFSQTYGGSATAAGDFATLQTMGNGSSTAANNDGNGNGLRIEHGADLASSLGASAFDATRAQVSIYGKQVLSVPQGVSLATGFAVHQDAMIRYNGGSPLTAGSPVAGEIGAAGDATLGDRARLKLRLYLSSASTVGGLLQWDFVFAYAFTT